MSTASPAQPPEPPPHRFGRIALVLGPVVATALAWRTSPGFGLLADARFLIVENTFLRDITDLWPNLTHDYFWSSSGNTIPYWRPLTKASWLLERLAFGTDPAGFHVVQVAWLLAGVVAVSGLARAVGATRGGAALAGLLFGLHPALVEPTALVMARSDVVAATATAAALWGWRRWQDAAGNRNRWLALHLVALAAALGSKEAAVVVAPLVATWAWLSARWASAASPPDRPFPILGPALPALALTAVALGLRSAVLGSTPGPALAVDPLRIVAGAGTYLQALFPLRLETGIRNLSFEEAKSLAVWLPAGLACLGWLAALGLAVRRRHATAVTLLLAVALPLAPVLLVADLNVPHVAGKIPMADRWLAPCLAPTLVGLVRLGERWLGPGSQRARWQPAVVALVLLWAGVRVALAAELHAPYATELALLAVEDRAFVETPAAFRTPADDCAFVSRAVIRAGARGDTQEVLALTAAMAPACRDEPENRFNAFAALVRAGRFAEARPHVADLLARPPADRRFLSSIRYLAGVVLVETGAPAEAEPLLLDAERRGLPDCGLSAQLGRVALAARRPTEAAQRFERAEACAARHAPADPMLRLAAAQAWLQAGAVDKARANLQALAQRSDLGPGHRQRLAELQARCH